ncbi:MAG: extracellular solute-binding protein [Candidatus Zixiibacteriota bacterium]
MKKILILAVLIVLFVSSCGTKQDKEIVITWWHFWTDTGIKPVVQEIVSDFETSHPGVRVELVDLTWADGHDKIAIAFSSGTGPDVVELGSDWIPEFSTTGHLLDLTSRTDALRSEYLMWEPGQIGDSYYAFPWILGTRVLFSNNELLTSAGYSPEYYPGYWNEWLTACQRVDALGDDIYGFGSNSAERHRLYKKFLPFLWSNGGRILSNAGTRCVLDSDKAVEALEFYLKLSETGLIDTQRRLEDAFLEGKIGFIISGDWLLKRIEKERPALAFSTQLIPAPDTLAQSISFAGGEYLCVNSKSKHFDMAFELIKHICSPENQLKFCKQNRTPTPASLIAASHESFAGQLHYDTFFAQLQTSKMPPAHPKWVYIEAALEKAIEKALYKTETPRQALKTATQIINEQLLK